MRADFQNYPLGDNRIKENFEHVQSYYDRSMTIIFHHYHTMAWYDSSFSNMSVNLGIQMRFSRIKVPFKVILTLRDFSGKNSPRALPFIFVVPARKKCSQISYLLDFTLCHEDYGV